MNGSQAKDPRLLSADISCSSSAALSAVHCPRSNLDAPLLELSLSSFTLAMSDVSGLDVESYNAHCHVACPWPASVDIVVLKTPQAPQLIEIQQA